MNRILLWCCLCASMGLLSCGLDPPGGGGGGGGGGGPAADILPLPTGAPVHLGTVADADRFSFSSIVADADTVFWLDRRNQDIWQHPRRPGAGDPVVRANADSQISTGLTMGGDHLYWGGASGLFQMPSCCDAEPEVLIDPVVPDDGVRFLTSVVPAGPQVYFSTTRFDGSTGAVVRFNVDDGSHTVVLERHGPAILTRHRDELLLIEGQRVFALPLTGGPERELFTIPEEERLSFFVVRGAELLYGIVGADGRSRTAFARPVQGGGEPTTLWEIRTVHRAVADAHHFYWVEQSDGPMVARALTADSEIEAVVEPEIFFTAFTIDDHGLLYLDENKLMAIPR